MKCFERLVLEHIKDINPDSLDPFQFAYRSNRSTEDAISITLHTTLSHLENKNCYARLFVDYSSAFNTVIPSQLITKLLDLGLSSSLCNWVLDFLPDRPQQVRIGGKTSSIITISTGTPQGSVLSPLLYSLYTHDCVAKYSSNTILKFADDTTVIGLISEDDETAYREEVRLLAEWCQDNNLTLNVNKTKEMIVDFRKQATEHRPINIGGEAVEQVSSLRFLRVTLTDDLKWSSHTAAIVKRAQQRLYFLRRLRKARMSPTTLCRFYRCTVESILTGCITSWYSSCSVQDNRALQRVVHSAQKITGTQLPAIHDIHTIRCLRKVNRIRRDPSHPALSLFSLLPSGRRLQSIWTRTSRFRNSFYPTAVRLMNNQ
uniref:Reverse transcriptase domain-containing protein n=1 Tax=Paramormyrops kingsleyae TaxID=1676925 RepID=A0A3B3QVD1_9TELE